ncbi:MAG: Rpn family recombination-promoting nuclease/putative transposase, partial [Alicyclobacillaceae bacterium]|nr:Rpn family recombination-promoting nuclease/putative transposase [Alicyclobacillaceae bacterium]
ILNPFLDKDGLLDKMSVLDVQARTDTGTLIDVEIQLWNRRDIEKRTLYYWAKMFESQLQEGDSYRKLHKAVTINVLDFDYIPTDRYHSTFHLREDTTGILLTDLLEIHFIELRKLRKQAVGLERRLVRWMLFLTATSRESLEGLAMQDPAIKKALTTLEFLSQDEEARRRYEERQKGLQTYLADIEGAKEEGRREVAKALLEMGDSVEKVVMVTKLSREEVEAIRKELLQ